MRPSSGRVSERCQVSGTQAGSELLGRPWVPSHRVKEIREGNKHDSRQYRTNVLTVVELRDKLIGEAMSERNTSLGVLGEGPHLNHFVVFI